MSTTLQLRNLNHLFSTASSPIPTPFHHRNPFSSSSAPILKTCIPQSNRPRRTPTALKRHVVSCSFAPMETAKIKVVGVGGGGNNAVNRMIGSGLQVGFALHFVGSCSNFEILSLKQTIG